MNRIYQITWNTIQERYKVLTYALTDTLFGPMIVVRSPYGIVYCGFVSPQQERVDALLSSIKYSLKNDTFEQVEETQLVLDEWKRDMVVFSDSSLDLNCLSGTEPASEDAERQHVQIEKVKLDIHSTPFQRLVWENLLTVGYGETLSYQQFAQRIGRVSATRAVASAIAMNPVSLLIPCHRIIRQNGEYGEYHWGMSLKKAILDHEKGKQPDSFTLF